MPSLASLKRARARFNASAHPNEATSLDTPYKSFFDNAVEGIFRTSPDGRYLQANPTLATIYGYESPAEMVNHLTDISSQLYVDSSRRAEFRAVLQAKDAVLGFESQVRRKDGRVIWIRENARAIRAADGRLIGYEGTVLDVTDRKAAEEALSRSRAQERSNAARIQQTLLLGVPPQGVEWLSFGALTIASQHIDGDFYDFHVHDDNTVDILLGDAMGKGIAAALLGAAIKSRFLRALAQLVFVSGGGHPPEPEEIIQVIHTDLTSQFIGLEFFSTLCYLRFNREQRRVTYVDCGHAKTIHWRMRSGECSLLEGENLPLGFSTKEVYAQCSVDFEPGDLFVCYSDGVTESADPSGEAYGTTRLLSVVASVAECRPDVVIERVRDAVTAHCCQGQFADDLTVIAVRVEG